MRVVNYYKQICSILEKLHKSHPNYNMGKHLATALDGSDLWGISDKEMLLALKKYSTELFLDEKHKNEDIDSIIKGGLHLQDSYDIEDGEDY